ncbi:hypothetical protein [Oscillatoria sp. HE19RPO]|uniref:hypothetical protein n=1 Tax=Oscillatoria sp. HE19RPO TaxID=2954806 RepID=UPI0020C4BA0C|nr:hypothetical protein [Oscillatoria sp. HE19RPO]
MNRGWSKTRNEAGCDRQPLRELRPKPMGDRRGFKLRSLNWGSGNQKIPRD